uniref:Aldo-keto reductase-like isoform X1 n=1 Tax=Rhizophora mucronata TaxID=61149 RepID=A0A2P2MGG7_RHIMU
MQRFAYIYHSTKSPLTKMHLAPKQFCFEGAGPSYFSNVVTFNSLAPPLLTKMWKPFLFFFHKRFIAKSNVSDLQPNIWLLTIILVTHRLSPKYNNSPCKRQQLNEENQAVTPY